MRRIAWVICLMGLLWVWFQGETLAFSAVEKRGRFYEPVEIPGEMFPEFLDCKLTSLGVYAHQKGVWQPIPFQIDERTPEGKFILDKGPSANGDVANGALDNQDLIVFLARYAGEIGGLGDKPPGAEVATVVEIIDPVTGAKSFVYFVAFPGIAPLGNSASLISLIESAGLFLFRAPTYGYDGLGIREGKRLIPTPFINKLWLLQSAGGSEQNIIDRQKIRGVITFLGGLLKVPFNESIVQGGVTAYKSGPIRILLHSVMYPRLPMKIKGPKFYIDSILVDALTLTTTEVKVPFDPGYLIHNMTLSLGMDLTPDAKGMKYYNSFNPMGSLIDGCMDEKEKQLDNRKDDWNVITGPQGTFIACTKFDPNFLRSGQASSLYNDNEKEVHPPENSPGDVGYASDQITVNRLPAGVYRVEVFGCLPYNFYRPQGLDMACLEEILRVNNSPLVIKVGSRKIKNLGGRPRMLDGK